MSSKLLIATTNPGKREELSSLLQGLEIELVTPDQIGLSLDVDETGTSYSENALLKAIAYCQASRLPAMADDTGLEVNALDGKPGLYSARYLGTHHATDAERRAKLVADLNGKPRPWLARFFCSVAVVFPGGEQILTHGEVRGEIQPEERGDNGFGYDRLFLIPSLGKTMAELTLEEKNHYSHRALAVKAAIPQIRLIFTAR